ncbi:MAG: DUF5615 family PIN-like protein [Candidatus Rokuibacteriota bacterium]
MKLYFDENLSPRIAVALRTRGIDAVSAHEVGNGRLTDAEQLAWAAGQGRTLVTGNVRDFVRLSRDAVRQEQPHSGVILCPTSARHRGVGSATQALVRIAKRYPKGLGPYDVIYL